MEHNIQWYSWMIVGSEHYWAPHNFWQRMLLLLFWCSPQSICCWRVRWTTMPQGIGWMGDWDFSIVRSDGRGIARIDGEITASHLLAFKVRLWEKVREWMDKICFLQSARFAERVRMSSALDRALKKETLYTESIGLLLELQKNWIHHKYRMTGERTEPWRTPRWT